MSHKAGFVSIIGNPNAGKSTLLNTILGENLLAVSPKAQTTRHRIHGILNAKDYQIVFVDTPGIVNPHNKLHEAMLSAVESTLADSDVFVLISPLGEDFKNVEILEKIRKTGKPIILLLNKIDLSNQDEIAEKIEHWKNELPTAEILPVSALHNFGLDGLLSNVLKHLPEHPEYYPKDEVSDRDTRFFIKEIIRQKILMYYKKEIPYSVEVAIESYEEGEKLDKISAIIYVERESQKGIIIGHQGVALKRIGTEARRSIENFLHKKIFLGLQVKVLKNWRDDDKILSRFGYGV
ncbi:MAG: GTPase Era [Bacteroidales bacterium]|jgi:GTP-binding protein Era|nr:GTPase Era [Bacteroidales bacterium]